MSHGARYATLDLGTNTFSCLVVEADPSGDLRLLADVERIVGLGEGLDRSGVLADAAIERGLGALALLQGIVVEHGAGRSVVVGTQALREARNARDFLRRAQTVVGAEIEVLSGASEAALTYRAVIASFPNVRTELVALDIGAGSTELIMGKGREPRSAVSLPIGSVRLTERHLRGDPPGEAEIARVEGAVDGAFSRQPFPGRCTFVAVGGTATTLLQVARGRELPAGELEGASLRVHDLDALRGKLATLRRDELLALPGMIAGRAPYLLAGATILLRAVKRTLGTDVVISGRGVRWGLLYDRFLDRWPVVEPRKR